MLLSFSPLGAELFIHKRNIQTATAQSGNRIASSHKQTEISFHGLGK